MVACRGRCALLTAGMASPVVGLARSGDGDTQIYLPKLITSRMILQVRLLTCTRAN